MARCRVDKSIERLVVDGFAFPLGVYPVEQMTPKQGFTTTFESADGGDLGPAGAGGGGGRGRPRDDEDDPAGRESRGRRGETGESEESDGGPPEDEWEEWPDRYVWDICIASTRVEPLFKALIALMPGRIFPILDVLGQDAYREIDPYVAYELVGLERFLDAIRQYRGYFFEDGLVGFGAMCEEPFFYVFVDEHKVVTVRAATDMKDRVEKVLAAFDLEAVDQIAAADAALHEHRSVLEAPDDRPDLLTPDEIVEDLRDLWGLSLNVDPEANVDEDGHTLGIVGWRVVVRAVMPGEVIRYAEILLTAENLASAHELAVDATQHMVETLIEDDPEVARPAAKPGPAPSGAKGWSPPKSPPPIPPESTARGEVPLDEDPGEAGEDDAEPLEPSIELDVLVADRMRSEDLAKALADAKGAKSPTDFSLNRVCAGGWVD